MALTRRLGGSQTPVYSPQSPDLQGHTLWQEIRRRRPAEHDTDLPCLWPCHERQRKADAERPRVGLPELRNASPSRHKCSQEYSRTSQAETRIDAMMQQHPSVWQLADVNGFGNCRTSAVLHKTASTVSSTYLSKLRYRKIPSNSRPPSRVVDSTHPSTTAIS